MSSKIRQIRKSKSMTMQELADSLGTSQQTIHRLEVGETALTTEWAARLAKALKCHPMDFVDWEHPEYEQWELDLIKVFRALPPEMRYVSMLEAIFSGMHVNVVEGKTETANELFDLSGTYSEVVQSLLKATQDAKTK